MVGWLREQGCTPITIDRVSGEPARASRPLSIRPIRSADLAAVCWQLCTMIEGGITLTSAVETIAEDVENKRLQKVLREVLDLMEKGESFSDSIARFPNVFNQLSYSIILAGESSGSLALSLRRVAEYFDNRDRLAKKVKGALAYPMFVFVFVVLVVLFIMTFIIPRFREILNQFGGKLPPFTHAFLSFYDAVHYNLPFIIAGVLVLILLGILFYSKTAVGHLLFGRIALRWPMMGKILKQAFLATFCRTMATLIEAGVPVLDVFDILSAMARNDVIRGAIDQTKEYVVQGSGVASGMTAAGFFPKIVIKMVDVGEQSGSLSRVLDRTADYYERKVDSTITTMLALLEPTLIVTVGAIVLVVVLALYLPIFSLSDIAG
ncbi:MAG: type II secretion system F family protein [Planctomycetota bacterium]